VPDAFQGNGEAGRLVDLGSSLFGDRRDSFHLIVRHFEPLRQGRTDEPAGITSAFLNEKSERPLRLELDLGQTFALFRTEVRQLRRRGLAQDRVAR
jgi:hypothetical protein